MELVEIAPHVHALLQPDHGLGWSNSGLIARGGGLVVDTFWDLPSTREGMNRYAEVIGSAPRQLVNTHHNGDHCWGNQIYAEAGTELIGHRLCAEYMQNDSVSPELLLALTQSDPAELPPGLDAFATALRQFDFSGIERTPPTTLFEDELEFDLDGLLARVTYVGPAHTAGDAIVHLPSEGVVFTGDILFNQCTPIAWEGTHERWVSALESIMALAPAVVVPGHGPIGDVDSVRGMRDYLVYVYDQAREMHAVGKSPLDAAMAMDLAPEYLRWTEPERLAFIVHRAYREFEGEGWDASIDVMGVFADAGALHEHLLGKGPGPSRL